MTHSTRSIFLILVFILAYAKSLQDELKFFIDAVTKQTIERRLLAPLVHVLSPTSIAAYTDTKVQTIAAEPPKVQQRRSHLENRRKTLEEGAKVFQLVADGL
jgi:hypothetical protein